MAQVLKQRVEEVEASQICSLIELFFEDGEKKEAGLAFVCLLVEPSRRRHLLLLTAALTLLVGGQTGAARLKIICPELSSLFPTPA